MKAFFQLALLGFAALASADDTEAACEVDDQEYMDFVEGCTEFFKDINDWKAHKDQYCRSKKIIEELNKNSSGAALFEVNCFADKTTDEIAELVGTSSDFDQGGRLL